MIEAAPFLAPAVALGVALDRVIRHHWRRRHYVVPEASYCARDQHVHGLIQAVDPGWQPGDSRDHINFLAGPDGHIERAELAL